MTEVEFKAITKSFAVQVISLASTLKGNREVDIICRQLIRSATSVGANYRAACRGRSDAEMLAKLGIVEEEADESLYWIELLVETNTVQEAEVQSISALCNSILRMTVTSIKTIRNRVTVSKSQIKEEISRYGETDQLFCELEPDEIELDFIANAGIS